MIKLVYTDAAQGDLVGLYEQVAGHMGHSAAEVDVQTLLDRCEDLARFPDMGRRRPDLDNFGLPAQTITQTGRLIVYTKRGDTLYVVRVLKENAA